MKIYSILPMISIQLFADGAECTAAEGSENGQGVTAGAASQRKGDKNPLSAVKYGIQEDAPDAGVQQEDTAKEARDLGAEFEKLIKGEYKQQFDARMQDTVQKRLKSSKEAETALTNRIGQMQPVIDVIAQKYGVNADDMEAIMRAMQEDDSLYEKEAADRGMSVQQLRQMKKMERENESLRKQMRERSDREQADAIYQKWMRDAETVKQQFPSFDLQTELQNPQFASLLRANIDVGTAYQVIHKDEIIPAAMEFTAREVQSKMASSVAANTARPRENGIGGGASAIIKSDVTKLTKADRQEIARRAMRGEKIRF